MGILLVGCGSLLLWIFTLLLAIRKRLGRGSFCIYINMIATCEDQKGARLRILLHSHNECGFS